MGSEKRRAAGGRAFALVAIVLSIAALFYAGRSAFMAAQPSASSQAPAAASSAPPRSSRAPWRRVHVGGGGRTAVELSDAEAVDAEGVGPLSGEVLSALDGRPIPGASLSFSAGELWTTKSDAGGRFTFQPPRAGVYELSLVTASGFLPFAPELGYTPLVFVAEEGRGLSGARVYLSPEVRYRVHVESDGGTALEGAEVRALEGAAEGTALAEPPAPVRTDAEGNASIVAEDGAIVEARAEGFQPGRAVVDVAAQIRGALTIVLRSGKPTPGLAIAGRVLDPDGQPAPDAVVGARFLADNPALPAARLVAEQRSDTDENGAFSLEDLEPGSWELVASAPGLAAATVRADAGDTGVVLRLTRGGALLGRITDAATGAPLASFSVIVSHKEGLLEDVVHVESTFAADGRYQIDALPAGDYQVTAKAHAHALAPARVVHIEADADSTADFALGRGGTVVGTVRDLESKAPIEGARISLEGYLPDESAIPLAATARTDADGRFELGGVSPGSASLFIAAPDHHARVFGGIQLAEGQMRDIEVLLTPLADGEEPHIELAGIGAVLAAKDDALVIGQVIAGGGAAEAGLAADDAIVAVDGVSVLDLGFTTAVERIRGPEGSSVMLRIRKAGGDALVDVLVARRRVKA